MIVREYKKIVKETERRVESVKYNKAKNRPAAPTPIKERDVCKQEEL